MALYTMWAVRAMLALTLALATLADADYEADADPWSMTRLLGRRGSRYTMDAALTVGEGGRAAGVRVRGELSVSSISDEPGLIMLQLYDGIIERQWGTDQWKKIGRVMGMVNIWAVRREGGNMTVWLEEYEARQKKNMKRMIAGALAVALVWGEDEEVVGPWGRCGLSTEELPGGDRRAALRCADGARRSVRVARGEKGRMNTLALEELLSSSAPEVRARSWLRLNRLPRREVNNFYQVPSHIIPHDIVVEPVMFAELVDCNDMTQLEKIVSTLVAGEEAGRGGAVELAGAVGAVREAVHAARAKLKDMVSSCSPSSLNSLLFALGLSGCTTAMAAADSVLQLATDAAADRAHHYFKGLSLAYMPQMDVIMWALDTGESARDDRIREAAILGAAGAMGRVLERNPVREGAPARDVVLQRLLRGLAGCGRGEKSSACRTVYLRALGALHHSDSIPALLEHAQRSDPRAAMAALSALAALHPALAQPLRPAAQPLLKMALDSPALEAPRPLEVRASALSLGTRLAAVHSPAALAVMARALASLRDPLASELRRLFWQLLEQLTAIPAVQELLKELPKDIMAQHMYALNGTSGSVHRSAWSMGKMTAAMTADTASAAGLLRQQVVRVALEGDRPRQLLTVEVGARGLHGLAGQPPPLGATDDEEVESTISMTVLGSPLPTLTLFSGQAALLGALWAGTGSEPTPILRATASIHEESITAPFLLGFVQITSSSGATAALDGSGVASLWSRTARATLELRAAIAANSTAIAHTEWGLLTATSSASANPMLSISADLDFYGDPILCVRANTPEYKLHSNSTVMTQLGKTRRFSVTSRPARSLALTKDIHAACRVTHATNED